MPFSQRAKTIALAIVKIFETSKPFGNYEAVAVLDDGAGISYGVNQFTHKSGSLYAVLERFMELGGRLTEPIGRALPDFKAKTNILARSNEKPLRQALSRLSKDPLMQQAQREIAFEKYLKPALEAAEGSNFELPLSLAVIYDSINHGSYAKIRDRVQLALPASIKPIQYEKEWITEYVKKRDAWLESVPRLAKTDYRTDFFLAQIARGNWELNLPLNVHGFKLTEETLFPDSAKAHTDTATDKGVMLTEQPPDSSKEPSPNIQDINIESSNVKIEPPAPPPTTDPVTVTKERTSIWAKVGAGIAILTGLGINFGQLVQSKLEALTPLQFVYAIGGVLLILGALYIYDKAQKRAHEKTLAKMATAADPAQNTVRLQ